MASAAERLRERVVLVVEDQPAVCRYMARALRDAGFRVLKAYDGEQAAAVLARFGSKAVGLVVSDVSMPKMTGLELALLLERRWPDLPVLLVSGLGVPPGYQGKVLPKPFTPDVLVTVVSDLLPPAVQ